MTEIIRGYPRTGVWLESFLAGEKRKGETGQELRGLCGALSARKQDMHEANHNPLLVKMGHK